MCQGHSEAAEELSKVPENSQQITTNESLLHDTAYQSSATHANIHHNS